MRLPARAPLLLLLTLSACGRFGFELQGQSGAQNPDRTPRDGGGEPLSDGAMNGPWADGQAPLPDDGGSNPTGDGGTGGSGDGSVTVPLDVACVAPLSPSAPLPVHRYAFDGTGTTVTDAVAGENGTLVGGATLNGGSVTLDGANDFIDLPNGLISKLTSTTIMFWVQWNSGPQGQAIIDFGSSDQGEGQSGSTATGVSLLASEPSTGLSMAVKTASLSGAASVFDLLSLSRVHQVTIEILPSSGLVVLYLDGEELTQIQTNTFSLADFNDVNMWLGRGQDSGATFFRGVFHDLRIYDRTLGPCAVLAAFRAGPDDVSFARCAQPEPNCTFAPYGSLGAWTCPTARTWKVASEVCAAAGMFLPNVDDSTENDALEQALGASMWTGYNDLTQEGDFVWCGPGSTYTAFATGEPSAQAGADCVRRDGGGTQWRAVDCNTASAFACEP